MPLTAREILAASFPAVKEAAKHVVIKEDDTLTPGHVNLPGNKKLHGAEKLLARTFTERPGKRKTYKTQVVSLDNEKRLWDGPIMVTCECDYFTYVCEVALAKKGAARIKQSNGEKPEVKNPKMVPTPCKHLHKLLSVIVKRRM